MLFGKEENKAVVILGADGKVLVGKTEEKVAEKESSEVTVKDLAKELGILPKSLRSRLRKNGYKKVGKEWGWNKDSKELAEIKKKFKAE